MKKYLIILVLALIGVFNAAYLSWHVYDFWNGKNSTTLQAMPCDISDRFSCSSILQNKRAIIFELGGIFQVTKFCAGSADCYTYSSNLKIVFPMIALIVYPILSLLALIGWFTKKTGPAKVLTALAGGGILFNSYVISQEFIVGVFCPLCAMCSVIIVTIFILSICIWKKPKTV